MDSWFSRIWIEPCPNLVALGFQQAEDLKQFRQQKIVGRAKVAFFVNDELY